MSRPINEVRRLTKQFTIQPIIVMLNAPIKVSWNQSNEDRLSFAATALAPVATEIPNTHNMNFYTAIVSTFALLFVAFGRASGGSESENVDIGSKISFLLFR